MRPRIEGYAIVSREGMIAEADGSFPKAIEIAADKKYFKDALDRSGAVVAGRNSAGPPESGRRLLFVTRSVGGVAAHSEQPNAVLWNPKGASFEEAWSKLGATGTAAVVGGTDVFGLFLDIGYDTFYLTQAEAKVPNGRPVFPEVGKGVTAQEVLRRHGYKLGKTRVLDVPTNTVLEEWTR